MAADGSNKSRVIRSLVGLAGSELIYGCLKKAHANTTIGCLRSKHALCMKFIQPTYHDKQNIDSSRLQSSSDIDPIYYWEFGTRPKLITNINPISSD